MEKILEAVSGRTGIPPEDSLSRRRDGKTAEARAIVMYISSVFGYSNTEIAAFVDRSRSNVSSRIRLIGIQAGIYKSLAGKIEDIWRTIGRG
jgi:chromosomal replication initiation ATPase DnaA